MVSVVGSKPMPPIKDKSVTCFYNLLVEWKIQIGKGSWVLVMSFAIDPGRCISWANHKAFYTRSNVGQIHSEDTWVASQPGSATQTPGNKDYKKWRTRPSLSQVQISLPLKESTGGTSSQRQPALKSHPTLTTLISLLPSGRYRSLKTDVQVQEQLPPTNNKGFEHQLNYKLPWMHSWLCSLAPHLFLFDFLITLSTVRISLFCDN